MFLMFSLLQQAMLLEFRHFNNSSDDIAPLKVWVAFYAIIAYRLDCV